MTHTLWYTRCPVPTASGIAFQRGMFDARFAGTGYAVRNVKELGAASWDSHFDHRVDSSFREGGGSPPVWARANDAPTRLLGITFMEEVLGIYVRADDAAASMQDLAGRRCALPVWPRLVFNFYRFAAEKGFYSALKVHGMREQDVVFVDVVEDDDPHSIINPAGGRNPQAGRRSYYHAQCEALLAGRVDAIFAKGGESAQLERDAAGRIRRLYDLRAAPQMAERVNNSTPRLLTVSESLVRDHPEAVSDYVGVLLSAGRWAQAHPADAAAAIAAEAGIRREDIARCFEPRFADKLLPQLSDELVRALEVMKIFLLERGYTRRDFDVAAWIDPGPLRRALARESQPMPLSAS